MSPFGIITVQQIPNLPATVRLQRLRLMACLLTCLTLSTLCMSQLHMFRTAVLHLIGLSADRLDAIGSRHGAVAHAPSCGDVAGMLAEATARVTHVEDADHFLAVHEHAAAALATLLLHIKSVRFALPDDRLMLLMKGCGSATPCHLCLVVCRAARWPHMLRLSMSMLLRHLLDCPINLCDLHCHMTGHAADMELRLASTISCVALVVVKW